MDNQLKSKDDLIASLMELQGENAGLKAFIAKELLEHEKIENALRTSEERFQLLFNKAPLGYQSLDFDGRFIEVNQQWLETLGYQREEVIGKWFGDLLSPAHKDGFRKRFPIFKAQGKIHSEFEMIHKDGRLLFIAFDGRIGYDLDGSFKQTHCILQDITEQKLIEGALIESENRMFLAIANSPVPIMVHDEDDTVLQLSKGWTNFSGYDIGDIPTLSDWTEKAYGSRIGNEKAYIDKLFEINQTVYNGEWEVTAKDGSKIIWDFQTTPLGKVYNGKRVLHSLAIDITARKQAEKVLLASKQMWENTFNAIADIVCVISPDHEFLAINNAGVRSLKIPRKEILGRKCFELVHEMSEPIPLCPCDKSLKTGCEGFSEYAQNGRYYALHAWPMRDGSGQITSFVHIVKDITERKQTDQEIIQQMNELQEWHEVSLNREERVIELKQEINSLLKSFGKPAKYEID